MRNPADRVLAVERFVEEWKDRGQEDEHDETFWNQFLQEVMGIARVHHIIDYQKKVKIDGFWKRIDAYIPASKVLIEQKSKGIDLARKAKQSDGSELSPYDQAFRYASYLPASEQPSYIITSNFSEFRIYDRNNDPAGEKPVVIGLEELPQQLRAFDFIVDPLNLRIARQQQVNIDAARLIGDLYAHIRTQYHDPETSRRDLAVLMVRILFCLYAEDSGLFEHGLFYHYLRVIPAGQGVFRDALIKLFKVLDTPEDKRDAYLGETLSQFPYVNGGLFADEIEIPIFNDNIKYKMLQQASFEFNWSEVSPVIFGSIFESILSGDERRAGGMHYTSVENIHKVIDPLFLDELRLEFQKAGTKKAALRALQDRIASLKFLDPACGSGNFLTETYLELRALENDVLRRLTGEQMPMEFSGEGFPSFVKVNVGQFYGIEINDFAVSVANTALWIADHQANQATARIINRPVVNLPLKKYDNIVCANALRIDWNDVIPASECSYIMGNPPFLGARNQNPSQKAEILSLFSGARNVGDIDYVAGWYMKAAGYIANSSIACAFVSTNSITQGVQVANIWKPLIEKGVGIDFAYKSFIWSSEATDKANVHCVIIGFSHSNNKSERIIYTSSVKQLVTYASHINPYLLDAPDIFIYTRQKPLCEVPTIGMGNQPIDDGNYLFTDSEKELFVLHEPAANPYFIKWLGADEFINRKHRWCLWLGDCSPSEIKRMPNALARVDAVRSYRQKSNRASTRKMADFPTRFQTENMPVGNYIVIPEVSSERRHYIPLGFLTSDVLCSNKLRLMQNGTIYHFGILNSQIHNAWTRVVTGRLKSDYQYSINLVYNNFIWPDPTDEQRQRIEQLAQAVLDARARYPDSSLADLYDPLTMPPDLQKAHKALDKAVEQAYGVNFNGNEEKIVAHLFKLYAEKTKGE